MTDNADDSKDHVLVVNGTVIIREGDPVDLDGNGSFDDSVYIGDGTPTSSAFAAIDKAVRSGALHWKTAARRKSQLAKRLAAPVS